MGARVTMEVNNKIEIYTESNEVAKSIIQEVSDKSISIAVPVLNGLNYLINNDEEVQCNYNDGKGNMYTFKGHVVGRRREKISLIQIEINSELKKVQRRNYVRVPFVNEVDYMPIEKCNVNLLQDLENCNFQRGTVLDLSGGGMKIQTKEELTLGQKMVIKTSIDNNSVLAICEIIRDDSLKGVKGKENIYGIKYKYIDAKVREKIIQFIFRNMRKAIKVR